MDDRILEAKEYIDVNTGCLLPLNELAEVACMSPKHFQREFRKNLGITPAIYVEKLRVKKSLELIRKPVPVYELAEAVGYTNYETFSRTFSKYCHIAPSELRDLIRHIEETTAPDAPVVISHSENPEHLTALVTATLENGTILPENLDKLKVCILAQDQKVVRSRKVSEKYLLRFKEELIPEILTRLHI